MKYLDDVIDADQFGKNYEAGYRIEISNEEHELICQSLEISLDQIFVEDNELSKEFKGLLEKIGQIPRFSELRFKGEEID